VLKRIIKGFVPAPLWQRAARAVESARLPQSAKAEIRADHGGRLFDDPGPRAAVQTSGEWLLEAQASSPSHDDGYARHYSLATGWGPSYPETTGYIIPTMLDLAGFLDDARYRDSARRALDWCARIQFPDGGFQGGMIDAQPRVPVTFNTGQILIGLAAGVREFSAYHDNAHRAARWLADSLDADGCWRRFPTPFAEPGEKTYETHVAWGLLEAARALDEPGYGQAALRNIRWAIGNQHANGWFADCCLSNPDRPLTHTLGYALRGIIEGYRYEPDPALLAAAQLTARALLEVLEPNGRIAGCFDSQWQPAATWSCLTGCVQIAACWFLLAEITGDEQYLEGARRTTAWVRRTVHQEGEPAWRGGVKGSYPVDGYYGHLEFLNWAAKFYVDANLMELRSAN